MMRFSDSKKAFYSDAEKYADLPDDLIDLTDEEYRHAYKAINSGGEVFVIDGTIHIELINPAKVEENTIKMAWHAIQRDAQNALTRSDIVVVRCSEDGVTVPDAWKQYRESLRLIVRTELGDTSIQLPIMPQKPEVI